MKNLKDLTPPEINTIVEAITLYKDEYDDQYGDMAIANMLCAEPSVPYDYLITALRHAFWSIPILSEQARAKTYAFRWVLIEVFDSEI